MENTSHSRLPRDIRRYFYEIDAAGSLYHDGTRLDDRRFLDFFFRRLRANASDEHPDFPWISPCGPEMNFVRCVGTPIVFDRMLADGPQDMLGFNHTSLTVPFEPRSLRLSEFGALLHPALPAAGIPMGRLNSTLTLELSSGIEVQESEDANAVDHETYVLNYQGQRYPIEMLTPPADSD